MTEQPVVATPPAPSADAYARSAADVQEPPRTFGGALRHVGPGLILAGAIVGTGELIATTNLGARAGFTLLWLVIVSCFVKVFVQVELGRYAISSGDTTMMAFKRLPGPGVAIGALWCVMMFVTQLQLAAMIGGVGYVGHMALPWVSEALGRIGGPDSLIAKRPELPWAVLTVLLTIYLLSRGSYRIVEWSVTWLVVLFTLVTIACVALLPASGHEIPWDDVGGGFAFQLPAAGIAVALAMFGITGVGAAELVAYPYWCIEKGYARKAGPRDDSPAWADRARGWLRVMRVDAWVACALYTVSTIAFYFLGAAVLNRTHAGGLPNDVAGMTNALTGMYVPVMGQTGATLFIVIGVFAVLYSTVLASTAGNSRALVDFLGTNRALSLDANRGGWGRTGWVKFFCVFFPIADFFLFYWIKDPVVMVIIGGVTQALMLPMIGAAAVYLRYRRTDRRITPGVAWDVFLWVSLAALTLAAFVGGKKVWDDLNKPAAPKPVTTSPAK